VIVIASLLYWPPEHFPQFHERRKRSSLLFFTQFRPENRSALFLELL